MVCASQPLAARIGVDLLKRGGSVVDAAIATNAALGLMEPTSCGVGGDLFALGWDNAEGKVWAYNGSGRSPGDLSSEELMEILKMIDEPEIPLRSALAVSVPGAVEGWQTIHQRYGRLTLAELMAPSIHHARNGFKVTPVIARHWQKARKRYARTPGFAQTYLPHGRAPKAEETFCNPDLAVTYRKIAEGGSQAIYSGPIAQAIVDRVQEAGGHLTVDDLAGHRGQWVDPVSVDYRGYQLWELGPNSQGFAALQMMRLLEGFDLASLGFGSAEALHLMVEAKKLAYADLARYCADPERDLDECGDVTEPCKADLPVGALLRDEYINGRRQLIDPRRASTLPSPDQFSFGAGDTVYLTAADSEGNVVSWIQSNYTGFGTGLVPEGCGFSLQNRGALFSLDPKHPNCYAPDKRPFHTIIPAMVTRDGLPVFSFGVMGGDFQPQGHLQVLTNIIDFGMDVQEAGNAPRWQHVGSQRPVDSLSRVENPENDDFGEVWLELDFHDDKYKKLGAIGHKVRWQDGKGGEFGGYQGIWIDHIDDPKKRNYTGATESRKDGCAIGY